MHEVWDDVREGLFSWDRKRGVDVMNNKEEEEEEEEEKKKKKDTTEMDALGQIVLGSLSLTEQGTEQGHNQDQDDKNIPSPLLLNPLHTYAHAGGGLVSACGHPQFTNFTPHFSDVLDWVFVYQKNQKKSRERDDTSTGTDTGTINYDGMNEVKKREEGCDGCAHLTSLDVRRSAPFPSEAQFGTHVALPSAVHPSDHFALACDLMM